MGEEIKKIKFSDFEKENIEKDSFDFEKEKQKETNEFNQKREKQDQETNSLSTNQKTNNQQQEVSPLDDSSKIKNIESILEQDLGDIYFKMSPDKQNKFKRKGEQTAREISVLLQKTKIKVKKIIKLIKKWLINIPGINKFFLEQEAKIKADKILELKNK